MPAQIRRPRHRDQDVIGRAKTIDQRERTQLPMATRTPTIEIPTLIHHDLDDYCLLAYLLEVGLLFRSNLAGVFECFDALWREFLAVILHAKG